MLCVSGAWVKYQHFMMFTCCSARPTAIGAFLLEILPTLGCGVTPPGTGDALIKGASATGIVSGHVEAGEVTRALLLAVVASTASLCRA